MRTLEEIKAGPLRLYSFVNYYLSDLQRGLQTAHLVAELFTNYFDKENCLYPYSEDRYDELFLWANAHKTIIILNGGNSQNLESISDILDQKCFNYPYMSFYEDKESLNCAITCVGLIFPEFTKQDVEYYADVADGVDNFIDLMRLIRSYPLA